MLGSFGRVPLGWRLIRAHKGRSFRLFLIDASTEIIFANRQCCTANLDCFVWRCCHTGGTWWLDFAAIGSHYTRLPPCARVLPIYSKRAAFCARQNWIFGCFQFCPLVACIEYFTQIKKGMILLHYLKSPNSYKIWMSFSFCFVSYFAFLLILYAHEEFVMIWTKQKGSLQTNLKTHTPQSKSGRISIYSSYLTKLKNYTE